MPISCVLLQTKGHTLKQALRGYLPLSERTASDKVYL